ncbi:MAG: permease [Desulfofustis sp.]|nr:permease [Desulfofustis sp.]
MSEEAGIKPCSCSEPSRITIRKGTGPVRLVFLLAAAAAIWLALYLQLQPFSFWLTYQFIGLERGTHLGDALQFFVYDTPKVLMLLTLVVFLIGVARSFVTVEWTRKILAGRRESVGNVLAALLGVITPFCSCSAVPLFIGFMTAGIPLGVTFSFLISAPMVNEIALVMLYGLLGWKEALLYFVTGISIAVIAGWVLGRLRLEPHVEDWVLQIRAGEGVVLDQKMSFSERMLFGYDALRDIVGKVWKYVVLGIGVGAAIHGYVPEGFLAGIMGKQAWWSVPASVLIGVPIYSNAAGVIPVVEALLGKGAALGTVLAFMMSVIALSLPEMVILRKVLKPRLIGVFIGVVASGILFVGFLFNILI